MSCAVAPNATGTMAINGAAIKEEVNKRLIRALDIKALRVNSWCLVGRCNKDKFPGWLLKSHHHLMPRHPAMIRR